MCGSGNILLPLLTFLCMAIATCHGLHLTFSGRNLPDMDLVDPAPEAYINIFYSPDATAEFEYVGRTAYISNNYNPDWEIFSVLYVEDSSQRLRINMYDADFPDADDYMGYVEIPLIDNVTAIGGEAKKNLIGGYPGGGQLLIKGY